MEIELFTAVTESFTSTKAGSISEVSRQLNLFINNKSYGVDIQKIKIGFILALDRPGYENWYKPRKIQYTNHSVSKSKLTGESNEVNRLLSFELKLDQQTLANFLNASDVESHRIIIQEIIVYLEKLDKLPKQVTDFAKEQFLVDTKLFLDSLTGVPI